MAVTLLVLGIVAASWPIAKRHSGWVAVLASLISVLLAVAAPNGGAVIATWIPEANVQWAFGLDGWSRLFWLLISGIGVVVKLFALGYVKDRQAEFFGVLTLFELAMLGVVLSQDLVMMFLFWEVTTFTSFLLIRWSQTESAGQAALRAWWMTGLPGLVMLIGIVGLKSAGIHDVASLANYSGDPWPLWLILVGCLAKSAQVPLHAWLPGTMVAPAPVSAYLHSATMVKAGIYLSARLVHSLPAETLLVLQWLGFGTLLFAGTLTLFQTDIKRILAYTTVAALGWMMGLIGVGTDAALGALVAVVAAHALYKSSLFLAAGAIEKAFGTRNISEIAGWGRQDPISQWSVVFAAVSMLGLPTTMGFMAKELSLKSIGLGDPTVWAFALGQIAMIGAPWLLLHNAKFNTTPGLKPMHPTLGVSLAPAVLGVVGAWFAGPFLAQVAASLTAAPPKAGLYLPWYGLLPEFWVSLGVIASALGLAASTRALRKPGAERAVSERIVQSSLDALFAFSKRVTGIVQSGSMRVYTRTFLIFVAIIAVIECRQLPWPELYGTAHPSDLILLLLGAASAWAALRARSRLGSILAAGGVGVVITSIFALYSATDLALTNLVTEILTLVLFAVMLTHLPRYRRISGKTQRQRDALFASGCGLAFAALVFMFSAPPFGSEIRDFYIAQSPDGAKALNVVNAILVDFRALDTLGEVAVLAGALIGVSVLIAATRRPKPQEVQ